MQSVGAGVLTKHPPLEPGPEGNYHLILKGNYNLTLKVDLTKGIIILLLKLSYISGTASLPRQHGPLQRRPASLP